MFTSCMHPCCTRPSPMCERHTQVGVTWNFHEFELWCRSKNAHCSRSSFVRRHSKSFRLVCAPFVCLLGNRATPLRATNNKKTIAHPTMMACAFFTQEKHLLLLTREGTRRRREGDRWNVISVRNAFGNFDKISKRREEMEHPAERQRVEKTQIDWVFRGYAYRSIQCVERSLPGWVLSCFFRWRLCTWTHRGLVCLCRRSCHFLRCLSFGRTRVTILSTAMKERMYSLWRATLCSGWFRMVCNSLQRYRRC